MKNLIGLCSLLFLLGGCASASFVTKPKLPKHAPKDYKPIGVVKYLNQGAYTITESRREDAFKKMSESCKGSYKVLQESERPDNFATTTYNSTTNSLNTFSSNYWYIRYECITK